MKKLILGIGSAALLASAGLVSAQTAGDETVNDTTITTTTTTRTDRSANVNTRLAAIDTSLAAFRQLDTDKDGRISALEANSDPRVAEAFPMADKDKDGFLSLAEFKSMRSAASQSEDMSASNPGGDRATDPSGDRPATSPADTGVTNSPSNNTSRTILMRPTATANPPR